MLVMLSSASVYAQFLFPESFVMIPLDTNRRYAGIISGSFSSQTQKLIVNQLNTRGELATRLKGNNILTFAQNFQLVRNGTETVLSGGYVFVRFRNNISHHLYPEYTGQYQWLEVRGLLQKVALTSNLRYNMIRTDKLVLGAAAGIVMEYEKWGYDGVPDERLPANTNPKEVYNPRFNSYISYDHAIADRVSLDMAVYYQVRTDRQLSRPRLGSHSRVNFKINSHLVYSVTLRLMEDFEPVVPVDPLWYNFSNEIALTF